MTCDYDNDRFNQGLEFQHPRESGHRQNVLCLMSSVLCLMSSVLCPPSYFPGPHCFTSQAMYWSETLSISFLS